MMSTSPQTIQGDACELFLNKKTYTIQQKSEQQEFRDIVVFLLLPYNPKLVKTNKNQKEFNSGEKIWCV